MPLPAEVVHSATEMLGHAFANESLLEEALTHSSAADNRSSSNERMEFLGDAVLDLVVCEKLFIDHPDFHEGDMTKMKSAIVSRRTCTAVARATGLSDLLIVGKGITGRQKIPASLSAAVYESVVAALYLDGGFEVAKRYVLATLTPHIERIVAESHAQNFKSVLQHHAQKELADTPQYELMDEQGPDHSKSFEIAVTLNGRRFPGAWGPNKKTAEQKAALVALRELEVYDEAAFEAATATIDAMLPESL